MQLVVDWYSYYAIIFYALIYLKQTYYIKVWFELKMNAILLL